MTCNGTLTSVNTHDSRNILSVICEVSDRVNWLMSACTFSMCILERASKTHKYSHNSYYHSTEANNRIAYYTTLTIAEVKKKID